jgi:XTP/dITP diphosphohydrolase
LNKKIVLATRNRDKVREITRLLAGIPGLHVMNLDEFPGAPDVVEDGKTLTANAIKKARTVAGFTGCPAVADDTGLEVDYLAGAPGVYSSRYSGENATYAQNVSKLLHEMRSAPAAARRARFRTVVAVCNGSGVECVEGVCEGTISETARGDAGFGYDPVFYVPELDATFAEMTLEQKNRISHRAKAFIKLRDFLLQQQFDLTYRP